LLGNGHGRFGGGVLEKRCIKCTQLASTLPDPTAKLRFLEISWACGVALASKVALLARNRVMGGVGLPYYV